MSKTITLRLSDQEYGRIVSCAQDEHRPISNFITHAVLLKIEEFCEVDPIEMRQILSDDKLMKKLKRGHAEAKKIRDSRK